MEAEVDKMNQGLHYWAIESFESHKTRTISGSTPMGGGSHLCNPGLSKPDAGRCSL
jgi:hypothetical protein